MKMGIVIKGFGISSMAMLLIGCSSDPPAAVPVEEYQALAIVGQAYNEAMGKLGRPPKNEEELRAHLKAMGDPDKLLRSPRDNEPYVIVYGRNIRSMPMNTRPLPVLAYEKAGKNGERYVYTAMGVELLNEADFAKADKTQK